MGRIRQDTLIFRNAKKLQEKVQDQQTEINRLRELLREAEDRIDDMDDRDFAGDLDEEAAARVRDYLNRIDAELKK